MISAQFSPPRVPTSGRVRFRQFVNDVDSDARPGRGLRASRRRHGCLGLLTSFRIGDRLGGELIGTAIVLVREGRPRRGSELRD